MPIKTTRVICDKCQSTDLQEIERQPLNNVRHYTDYKITYRCKDCGNIVVSGDHHAF